MKLIKIIVILLNLAVCAYAQPADTTEIEAEMCGHLDEVVVTGVTGNARMREIASPISIISNMALNSHLSTNIIDAISRQPGVSQLTTGSGISKPVIRGLGYNRVLVVSNGIRQEGQHWGDEHGIEIDGQSIHSVEILKGPASLMYGSDAMAGVVIMNDAPLMPLDTMCAEAGAEYQSNNGLFDYTLDFRGNRNGFVWNWRWSQKLAHDYHAPQDGYVPNSRFREKAINGMLGINKAWGHSHLKMSYYHLSPGMTEIEDEYEKGSRDYDIIAPYQQVRHYKAVLDNSVAIGDNYIKAIFGYQQNRRQEYEGEDDCGLDFRLHTANYDLRYVLAPANGWKANFGIGGMYQESENLGTEFLIPAYRLFDIGAFATVSQTFFERLHLSGGLRYDRRNLHSLALTDDGQERFADFSRDFGAMSGSIGAIYNMSKFDVKINVSHGFRAPNISELGSNGEHEGTFRYELGNSALDPEHSWQFDLGFDYTSNIFSTSLALFANHIGNYIFLKRTPDEIDETPIYQFTSGDARIMGGEARVVLHLFGHLHFENALSYVDAQQLNADDGSRYLPTTPAPRLLTTLHYDVPLHSRRVSEFYAEVEVDNNFRQDHVMSAYDTETPTPAYSLLNISLGTDICTKNGNRLCTIVVTATNVLDKAYQSHLSRLKYADTHQQTGRCGINNIGRNFGFKLTVPVGL